MSETMGDGTAIQFGLFDWIEWDRLPASDIYEQRLKMLEYADRPFFFAITDDQTGSMLFMGAVHELGG